MATGRRARSIPSPSNLDRRTPALLPHDRLLEIDFEDILGEATGNRFEDILTILPTGRAGA